MTKDYNWRTDFNWQDKKDEPVGESKFPQLTEVDKSFKTEAVPFLDFEKPFQAYLKNVINFNEKQDRRHFVINLKGTQ